LKPSAKFFAISDASQRISPVKVLIYLTFLGPFYCSLTDRSYPNWY